MLACQPLSRAAHKMAAYVQCASSQTEAARCGSSGFTPPQRPVSRSKPSWRCPEVTEAVNQSHKRHCKLPGESTCASGLSMEIQDGAAVGNLRNYSAVRVGDKVQVLLVACITSELALQTTRILLQETHYAQLIFRSSVSLALPCTMSKRHIPRGGTGVQRRLTDAHLTYPRSAAYTPSAACCRPCLAATPESGCRWHRAPHGCSGKSRGCGSSCRPAPPASLWHSRR